MNKLSSVKRISISAVCVALCCVLPMAFHSVGLGGALSPMHIPVLLCGMVCGGLFGTICGILGPILSSVITSMPGAAMLPTMVPELIAYGLVTGLMMRYLRTGKNTADLYISLGVAMLVGRIVGGIAKVLFFLGSGEGYTFALWISSYFVSALPGIICHLILVPVLVLTLTKAKLIPSRYPKQVTA